MSLQTVRKSGGGSLSRLVKVVVSLAIVGPVLWLLERHIADMDSAALSDALRAISLQSVVISGLLSAVSLYAVARYDRLAINQMGLQVTDADAVRGGFAAVSIGQTLGMGLVTGSAVRWRMYRHAGVSLPQAAVLSGLVMAGFLVGFVAVLAVAVQISADSLTVLTGLDAGTLRLVSAAVLAGLFLFTLACVFQPRLRVRGRRIPLPGFRVLRAQVSLAALDTVAAALALWVLIPGEGGPEALTLIPIYLVALGIGLVSNAPGGLGVLELTCLMALPVFPPEHLLAALIAHRAIYYGVPALVAGAMLVARELNGPEVADSAAVDPEPILAGADRAETMLALLGDKTILTTPCGRAMVQYCEAGNSMVVLGDPVGPQHLHGPLMDQVRAHARRVNRAPVLYKGTAAILALAAERGMTAARLGLDAVLDPRAFTEDGSSFRELRRKLRAAEKAGVTLRHHAPGHAPLERLAPVSAAWAAAKGGERGFSMGYFRPDYVARQPIVEARLAGRTVGFLSLMVSGDGSEFCADVMRLTGDAPDGTMHLLMRSAIDLAAATGARRFSLAAVPFAGIETPVNWLERALAHLFEKRADLHGSQGLMRFKNAFRPDWEPRYVIAPSLAAAGLGLIDALALIGDVEPMPTLPQMQAQEPLLADLAHA